MYDRILEPRAGELEASFTEMDSDLAIFCFNRSFDCCGQDAERDGSRNHEEFPKNSERQCLTENGTIRKAKTLSDGRSKM